MAGIHSFSHDAMKTTFTIRINDPEMREAAGVARECFEYLDYIETKLNRYLEGSDIWQINHMHAGETLYLSEVCYDCLKLAMEAYQQTGGLFDISVGRQIEHVKSGESGDMPGPKGKLAIDPEKPAVHCQEAGRELDLGGIGKGFALDRMKDHLQEWGISSALLSAGASTQLCFGDHAWPIELCGDHASLSLELKNNALSASGVGIQGSHIVSPLSGMPEYLHKRIWITHSSAALADAWSTAMMLMNQDELHGLDMVGSQLFTETAEGGILEITGES